MAAIRAWFRMAGLTVALWIPTFAGMTGLENGNDGVREREWQSEIH